MRIRQKKLKRILKLLVFANEVSKETHSNDATLRKYQMDVVVEDWYFPHEILWQLENMKIVTENSFYLMSTKKMAVRFINILQELNTCIKEMDIGWSLIRLAFMKLDCRIRSDLLFEREYL